MKGKQLALIAVVILAGAAIAYFVLQPQPPDADAPESLVLGAVLPLTGNAAFIGQPSREGIEMAVETINGRGGIKGAPIELVLEDSTNDSKTAISALQKLLNVNSTPAIITALSAPSFPIAEYLKTSGSECVQVATFVTPTGFTGISPMAFRLYNNADQEARLLAEFITQKLALGSAVVYYNNDDYGKDVNRAFSAALQELGGEVIASETFDKGQPDHKPALTKLKAADADAILFVGNDQSFATAIKQAREAAIDATFVATTGFSVAGYRKIAGIGAEKTYFAAPTFEADTEPTPKQAEFEAAYEQRYGKPASILCAFPYACVELLAEAATRAPSLKAPDLQAALLAIDKLDTVVGTVSVSPEGDAITGLVIKQIVDGQAVQVEPLPQQEPAAEPQSGPQTE